MVACSTMAKNQLITDSFPVKKRTEPITKTFPQTKLNKKPIQKTDDDQKVHQEAQPRTQGLEAEDIRDLDILKDFDMRCEYGPCIGITRLERWKRAEEHELEPPKEVREIIEKHENDSQFTECVWHDEELL